MKTEAQLSQRNRATLRVTEYFANNPSSLKIIRNNTLEYGVCKSLLAFHYKCFYLSHSIAQQQLVIVQPIISLAAFDDEGR